jgi:predicted site-specific integrase-resolvase
MSKRKISKRKLRKRRVADRYGVDPRTIDRWAADGKIPLPFYHQGSRIPFWDEDELDDNDRAATRAAPANRTEAAA